MAVTPDTTLLPEMSRPVIEAEIERLIGLLDPLDPDPDLDGGDGEAILGGPESRTGSWSGLYPEPKQTTARPTTATTSHRSAARTT